MARPRQRKIFKDAVARALRDLLRETPGLTQVALAKELGVSRQAVHQYLTAKAVPNQERLARAVHKWKLKLKVDRQEYGPAAFGPIPQVKVGSTDVQLRLPELRKKPALLEIPGSGVKLKVGRRGLNALEITVQFDLTAA